MAKEPNEEAMPDDPTALESAIYATSLEIANDLQAGKLPPLGTLISPAALQEGHVTIRAEALNTATLLNSLVCFVQENTPYLGQISDVTTFNPYMDPNTIVGQSNMSFIANRGRIPHTEDSDIRFATVRFLCLLGADNRRYKLRNSPNIGLGVVGATTPILNVFYPFKFPENLAVGFYLNTKLALPLDVRKLKEVHCGIFGITGWGKSVLQAYLAALYVRTGSKVLIFDHTGEYAKPGSFVQIIFNKLVGPKNYKVRRASDIRADHDLLGIKLMDVDFWMNAFTTTANYAMRVAQELINYINDKYPDDSTLTLLNADRLIEILKEVLPLVFTAKTAEEKTRSLAARGNMIRKWFDRIIKPYLTRPLTFSDVKDDALKQSALVLDLTGEEMPLSEKTLYVHKLGSLLYQAGKQMYEKENKKQLGLIFMLDEAHNYVPEKLVDDEESRMWQARSRNLVTTIAKEGRKYGMGLCLADQRITAVDKEAIDFQTYFLGKLQMAGDQGHVKAMFGENALTAISALRDYQFVVVGGANPLEDAPAPVQVFDPQTDLDYVLKLHTK